MDIFFTPRYLILTLLFMGKTVPSVFFMMAFPVILRTEGHSLEVIGLLQLASVFYLAKPLWAPLINRNGSRKNHYKNWTMAAGLGYGLLLVLLGFLNLQDNFSLIVILVMVISFASATQDIAISTLYIKLLSFEERGPGATSKVFSLNVGGILGSGLFLLIYNYFGWQACASSLGITVFLPLLLLPLLEEKGQQHKAAPAFQWSAIFSFFKKKGMVRWFCLAILNSISASAVFFMIKPFLVDKGVDIDVIAFLLGFYGMGVSALFAAATGSRRFQQYLLQRRRAYLDSVLITAVAGLPFIPIALYADMPVLLFLSVTLLNFGITISTVVSGVLVMDFSRKGLESIDYSLQMTGIHLGALVIAAVSGFIVAATGYTLFFTGAAAVGILMIPVSARLFRGRWIPGQGVERGLDIEK
ncbi:MAG: MFS transporter [Desulfobacterales bacterium]|nr:MFS transporter [Desulfobacterales bacterium]